MPKPLTKREKMAVPQDEIEATKTHVSPNDIVTDPQLRAVLAAAELAHETGINLVKLLESHPPSTEAAEAGALVDPAFEAELSKQHKLLAYHLAQVRGLHRNAILDVRQTKQATADARHEIDALHLHLQNLYYEQRHLLGEIHAAVSYEHKYTGLPLMPVSEFREQFPEYANKTEHELWIARIEHEHKVRLEMEAKRQELLKRKQELVKENQKRKEDLANLDKQLERWVSFIKLCCGAVEREEAGQYRYGGI
jgi:THO complex subunit 5